MTITAAAMAVKIPFVMFLPPRPASPRSSFSGTFSSYPILVTVCLLAQMNGKHTITINIRKERGMYKVSNLQRVSVYRLIGISSTAAMN